MRAILFIAAYVALAVFMIKQLIAVETFGEFVMYIIISAIAVPIINIVMSFVAIVLFGEE